MHCPVLQYPSAWHAAPCTARCCSAQVPGMPPHALPGAAVPRCLACRPMHCPVLQYPSVCRAAPCTARCCSAQVPGMPPHALPGAAVPRCLACCPMHCPVLPCSSTRNSPQTCFPSRGAMQTPSCTRRNDITAEPEKQPSQRDGSTLLKNRCPLTHSLGVSLAVEEAGGELRVCVASCLVGTFGSFSQCMDASLCVSISAVGHHAWTCSHATPSHRCWN
ncbi:unnamed protein product [Eretmochelys imbricata]